MKKFLSSRTLHITFLILAAGVVYANSLGGEFVFDDKAMISGYDLVKDVSNIPRAFVSPTSLYGNVNYYRPLQTVSYMVDYYLWGDVPAGFHMTNILFHAAAAAGLYVLILMLFRSRALAFMTSLLFAAHPVHTSVVAYVAGRADAMLAVFMFACLALYFKYRYRGGGRLSYAFSLFFFVLALLVKEYAMMIPVLMVFFDMYLKGFSDVEKGAKTPPKAPKMGLRGPYLPFAGILGAYAAYRLLFMSFFVQGAMRPFPLFNRIISVPYLLGQYLRLAVLPNDLHIGRALWAASTPFNDKVLVSLVVLGVLYYAAYTLRNKMKELWFGLMWFTVLMIPSLNVITPLFYTLAENWLYIPSAGVFLIMAAAVKRVWESGEKRASAPLRAVAVLLFSVPALIYGSLTVRQNLAWKDEISLGKNTLKYNPREFKIYNNVGVAYLGKGELAKAEEYFRECLEIKPDTGMAYFNLYRVYIARGKRAEAVGYLDKARELDPERVGILIEKMGIRD